MKGGLLRCLCMAGLCLAEASAQKSAASGGPQGALAGDLTELNSHLNGNRVDSRQIIADAERLTANYRGLTPYVGRFGPADFAQNRLLARQTFAWLARANLLYASDPVALQALGGAYGYLGGFYSNPAFSIYPYAAVTAYAGANRVTRALLLGDPNGGRWEAELQRLGMAWAAAAYVNGRFYGEGIPEQPGPPPPQMMQPDAQPMPLPKVDVEKLTPEQVGQWREVSQRFSITATKVHDAQALLDQLSARLFAQSMSLNPRDVAAALMMQGFLEDASRLASAGQFELAKQALVKAEYQRTKLRSVTGQ